MVRIVAIGECMGELSETGTPGALTMGFAGDTLNTAWYLRRLLTTDHHVDYLTATGTDGLSDRMLEFFETEGLGTQHIQRIPDKTIGLYYITLKDGERSFTYWRSDSAARRLASDPEHLEIALDKADIAYWSGITLAILPLQDRLTLLEALGRFAGRGGRVVFDPNLRPRLWDTVETMRGWINRAIAVSDLCLPSFEDEALHYGDSAPDMTAARFRDAGAKRVVVKNGAGEILLCDAAGGMTSVSPPIVDAIVDTTAAGDSFNAGFLAAELAGSTMHDAALAGARLAGRVIGARGALVLAAIKPA